MRAKGITVDVEALRKEYITQHRGQLQSSSESEDNDEDPIDVVGGTDGTDDESDGEMSVTYDRKDSIEHLISSNSNSNDTAKHSLRPNPFSIENILFRNT